MYWQTTISIRSRNRTKSTRTRISPCLKIHRERRERERDHSHSSHDKAYFLWILSVLFWLWCRERVYDSSTFHLLELFFIFLLDREIIDSYIIFLSNTVSFYLFFLYHKNKVASITRTQPEYLNEAQFVEINLYLRCMCIHLSGINIYVCVVNIFVYFASIGLWCFISFLRRFIIKIIFGLNFI